MTDDHLIQQLESILTALRAGEPDASDRLVALLGDPVLGDKIAGDKIEVGHIDRARAVAIGRGARVVVYEGPTLPPEVVARLAALADILEMRGVDAPPPLPDDIPVVDPGAADYIFISYARPDQPIAERVEEYLKRAGFRVFRDTSAIRSGANWDMVIERALRETGRMVLLLSEHSMYYRKEVHREWFYYDQQRKPLHPLYLRPCDLHSRMASYNYIAVGDDLYGALARLVQDLISPWEPVPESTARDRVVISPAAGRRPLPEAFAALLAAVRGESSYAALSPDTVDEILRHRPADLTEYRLSRIAEWSQPKYQLDDRFVALTLLIDQGERAEGQRFIEPPERPRFNDLRAVLAYLKDHPALVLLGEPGCGKSTLLRRLQLDDSIDRLREGDEQRVSFFVPLNAYRAEPGRPLPLPLDWLAARWAQDYPDLPPLRDLLAGGRVLLLLDALNEMPHQSAAEYAERVGNWQQFVAEQVAGHPGNRAVFSCRTLDYSSSLSTDPLPVPQVQVQRMDDEQVQSFLRAYLPAHAAGVWRELQATPRLLDLVRTPYYLKLLTEQVEEGGRMPAGRAGLFTGFVRRVLRLQVNDRRNPLLLPDSLLDERDHTKLANDRWASPFDLPERGLLIPRLSDLAFRMQQSTPGTDSKQVTLRYDDACRALDGERGRDIVRAGRDLSILDEDIARDEVKYFHQLLQEYFAARRLARSPDPDLARVEWRADRVSPSLAETLAGLADSDPLPPLPATGWEETAALAAAMAGDPAAFIRGLMPANLPLAARCAASPEVAIPAGLKREIQDALIARTEDPAADLRARIAAGEALGTLGDPRFERREGPHGPYLLPPLVSIPGGEYPIGDDDAPYDDEKPAHTVKLAAFQIGRFPVTNAEYALFMAAGGYEDERWWETEAARAWLRGEGSSEGQKQYRRDMWKALRDNWTPERIQAMVPERFTSEEAEWSIWFRGLDKTSLEELLEAWYPEGQKYRQPEYWDDSRFNNPAQPVVGVTWYEARAYCAWLAAQTGRPFRLPREVEREAAARGLAGRRYAYGPEHDPARCNTFETHVRRTTPVGVFPGGETPEGAADLTGNVWDWTSTLYDRERFPYRYDPDDGREDPEAGGYRVVRGGSWYSALDNARASYRVRSDPSSRNYNYGFRCALSLDSSDF